jgi:hypothetical protein
VIEQRDKSMRKELIALTLLLCLTAFTITLVTVNGQTTLATPNVKPGDTFIYTTFSTWASSDNYASIPATLQSVNQTQAIEVRISNANDSFVDTFTATYYYNQGPIAGRGSTNVNTGEFTNAGFPAIIGGNLNQGQIIHPLAADGIYINQTKTGTDGRPFNEIYISEYNATIGVTSTSDRYFDQATGMLTYDLESTVDGGAISGTTSTEAVTLLLKSSPWNPQTVPTPEFQPIFALPIFIGAATLVLIVLKKKHMISGNPVPKT